MRPPAPCWNKGDGCPNRHVGCHAECEDFLKYRKAIDAENAERDRVREVNDTVNQTIYKKRHTLVHTAAGRRALSQR